MKDTAVLRDLMSLKGELQAAFEAAITEFDS